MNCHGKLAVLPSMERDGYILSKDGMYAVNYTQNMHRLNCLTEQQKS